MAINVGDAYVEAGATAVDDVDGDLTGSIAIDATALDINTPGSYPVTYNVSDAAGNPATQVIRTVNVSDGNPPVITLLGDNPLALNVGQAYVEPGATALDDVDGDISGSIAIDATALDINTPGSYPVTYNVSNSTGNPATEVIRTVNVSDGNPPVITLLGDNPLSHNQGSVYTDPGATATDDVDGDISSNIVIDATAVDVNTPGSYPVTYNVSDAAGNPATQVIRTVTVIEATCGIDNLALNQPASQSSQYSDGQALLANDGNQTGSNPHGASADLQHTNNESQPWWQVDLGDSYDLQRLDIYNRTNGFQSRLSNFYVLVSETPFAPGASLATLLADTNISNTFFSGGAGFQVTFNSLGIGRYIRIQLSGSGYLHMAEVEVFGCGSDVIAPVITLLGDNPLALNVGDAYVEAGATAVDDVDGDLTGSIAIDATALDINTPGSYPVTYNVSDAAGNPATQVIRTVNVSDGNPPVITLLGDNPLALNVGQAYVEPGATALDDVDGDISGSIAIDATALDINTPGSYPVTYNVSNSTGNPATEVIRTVNVSDGNPPVITLLGDNPLSHNQGSVYTDPGATATDDVDGDISSNIVIDATAVDVNTPGSYPVTYNVSDAAGNPATQVIRTVTVIEATCGIDNLALNQPASQSSQYSDGQALLANDGNQTGSNPHGASADLQHTNNESQPWWQVDLGDSYDLQRLDIYNRTNGFQSRLSNFYVLVSETPFAPGASLATLLADTNISNTFFSGGAGLQETFNSLGIGRYIRIQLSGSGYLHMAEVEVFGCPANPSNLMANLNDMTISPNPANTNTDLMFDAPLPIKEVNVFDVSGRLIKHLEADDTEEVDNFLLQVKDLAEGIYFVRIRDANGWQYQQVLAIKR